MKEKKLQLSLKIRIFLFFFGILSAMILIFIVSFYHFISKSTFEKMDQEYASMANELNETSQNLLWKLTLTSQQLLENEEVQSALVSYQECNDPYQKQTYYSNLLDQVSALTISETDVALFYFYDPEQGEMIYSSLPVDQQILSSSCLYRNALFQYRGPVSSQSTFVSNPVFILNRETVLSNGNTIHFSIESGYYSLDKQFSLLKDKSAYVVFLNDQDTLLYNTLPEKMVPADMLMRVLNGNDSRFHVFSQEASQGWRTFVVVPTSTYTAQYRNGLQEFIYYMVLLSLIVAVLAFSFWRSIYHPLHAFDKQLELVLTDDVSLAQTRSSIPEFDYLFHKIALLQKQVREMLEQTIRQEKEKTRIQVEKLRAQINPHFLINTLNTLHWLALMNHQKEIDEITQALSHLLSYNLDKDSYHTTLQKELNAIGEYVRLQKVRYQFTYTESIDPPGSILNYPCPKFILQPLVENALSHGYREGMDIVLSVRIREQDISVQITDTGNGMDADTLYRIRELFTSTVPAIKEETLLPASQNHHSGKSIGLSYVVGILHLYYEGQAHMTIDSQPDHGTQITLLLPKMKGCGYHVENTDCG